MVALLASLILAPLLLLAVGCAVYFGVVLTRIGLGVGRYPSARAGLVLPAPPSGWPSLCVIVPAHDEAEVIGGLAASLARVDYPDLRVVFVLDRCTDDTEGVLRRALRGTALEQRTEILAVEECPEGWAGKVHALHRGATTSRGAADASLLLFVDADTELHPQCLRATVALLHQRDLDLLSLLSTLRHDAWFERLVQPATGFELVRQYPIDLVNRRDSRRHFANGQFMLFRRAAYETIGGHAAVRDELLEDIALARAIGMRRHDFHGGCLMANGMLHCRMYRSWADFRRGWQRIFTEAAKRKPARLRSSARRLLATGVILPSAAPLAIAAGGAAKLTGLGPDWLAGPTLVAGIVGTTFVLAAVTIVYAAQHAPLPWVLAYPVGAWWTQRLLRDAARDLTWGRATEWAGRTYVREVRE